MYRTIVLFFAVLLALLQPSDSNPYGISTKELLEELNQKTSSCSDDLGLYIYGITLGEPWAISMFDATSKLLTGLTRGNLVDLGDFDLCLSVKNESDTKTIKGKYCMGLMTLVLSSQSSFLQELPIQKLRAKETPVSSLSWRWSFCMPDSCSGEEGAAALTYLLQSNQINAYVTNFMPDGDMVCQTEDTVYQPMTTGAIVATCFFSLILVCMIVDTVYDVYLYYSEKEPRHELLIAFSVLTNGRKLFKIVKREEQLPCLDGLRFISMMWVVLGHRFSAALTDYAIVNTADMFEWADKQYSMYIGASTLSVDTFFLIGGLLVTYGYMRAMSKGIKFNIPMYYIHRYLRLTPALAALILLMATLTPYISNGPNFPIFVKTNSEVCHKYWWTTLLYVQNYVNIPELCMGHTWYLNVDTQLFFLSPILLIPLKRWPKPTIGATVFLILANMGGNAYTAVYYQISALSTALIGDAEALQKHYYMATHTRAAPWLIGFILGYYIFQIKSKAIKFNMSKLLAWGLWGASFSLLLTCIFAGHDTLRGPEYDETGNALHMAFIRPVWALALSWVILACLFGYGGPINGLLSLPIFQVLNRLTYSLYLIHVMYIYGNVYARRTNDYFSDGMMFYLFWGDFAISIIMAIVWTLAFESPMIIIEKYIFGRQRQTPKPLKENGNLA